MKESEALRQRHNEWSNRYFAIAMGGMMVLFMARHWFSVIYFRYTRGKSSTFSQNTLESRALRRILFGKVFGLPLGQLLLYATYWATNLILLLTDVTLNFNDIARRLGWISVANLALLVFLALKNTPLAPLTAQSYDKLRPLHKTAGYTCIVTSVSHGVLFLIVSSMHGKLHYMRERKDFAGAIGGFAMVIICLSTGPWTMPRLYEAFYLIHITCFILILITIGMHRPNFSTSTLSIIIFTASIWIYDRIVRAGKLCWKFSANYAIIAPLPNNAVLVELSRPIHSQPGSHAFLWIPHIRWFETHPFTMTSTNPVKFVIQGCDGFTSDLRKAAVSAPGRSLRCSIDGGYGQVPNFGNFGKVILVAGGSGASFTFPIALSLIEEYGVKNATKSIDFIWAVRHRDSLDWFKDELKLLEMSPMVNLIIHVTRDPSPDSSPSPALVQDPAGSDVEKGIANHTEEISGVGATEILKGRPSIADFIDTAVASADMDCRIIVGVCGPGQMIDQTQKATSRKMHEGGRYVTLYTEKFKW